MPTLSLLRHAKSSWDDPGLDDFDRPLAPRGQKAAPAIGRWLLGRGLVPDLVLCSPAARARETCEKVLGAIGRQVPVSFDESIYMASPRTLLALVRGTPSRVHHLMLIGHNPGLHALATALIGAGPEADRARLDDKLPTGGLVMIELDADTFADLRPGTARLVELITPRSLPGDAGERTPRR